MNIISEGKGSPYTSAHPSFGGITSKMRAGGLSSAPLDTIKFIREILYTLDIIDEEELRKIKTAPGFSGKKQAMLSVLKSKQSEINLKSKEIANRVSETLDDFISSVTVNRGREEKYAAQASAREMASQMRQTKSGKQMDDALTDLISDESLLVKTAVAKILAGIQKNIGEPGFDIEEEALIEVMDYVDKVDSLEKLKSFIKQLKDEPGYEKIAAYLSSAVGPISRGTEDEEMEEEEGDDGIDDFDLGQIEDEGPSYEEDITIDDVDKMSRDDAYEVLSNFGEYSVFDFAVFDLLAVKALGLEAESEEMNADDIRDEVEKEFGFELEKENDRVYFAGYRDSEGEKKSLTESNSYTAMYIAEMMKQVKPDKKPVSISFKERFKPKTHWQLEELKRSGM